MSLDVFLGQCYAAEHLGKGNLVQAKAALKKQLADGSAMATEARARIASLEPVKERCYISKKHLEYIKYGLVQ